MKKLMTRAAETALAAGVAGGVLLIGASVAGAQEAPTTAEGDGTLAGNAVNADLDVPVTLCGIAGSLLGVATGTCELPPPPPPAPDTTVAQASGDGLGTGNAVGLDVDAPITVCGVGVVGGGVATGVCHGAPAPGGPAPAGPGGGDTTVAKAQGNGTLAGNAIGVDIDAPITVCGVGGALLGVATGTCALPPTPPGGGTGGDTTVAEASGNGFLTGNALGLDIDLPINICGIGIAVGGVATGDCVMPAGPPLATTGPDNTSATASGNGFLAGNAIAGDIDAPITVCGVGAVGLGVATGVCHVGPPPPPPPCPPQCPPPPCPPHCPPPPCPPHCPPPPCPPHCPPPPCPPHCPPPPPCSTNCPPPPCKDNCPPPPPPPACKDNCPPPPHTRMEHGAPPVVHRGGAGGRMSELPRTGGVTDVALPLGAGLVAAGMAFMAAARRRLARLASVR
jgi:hypothetical protein